MTYLQVALLAVPISLMLLAGLVPSAIADRCVVRFRRAALFFAGLHMSAAVGSAVWMAVSGGWHWNLFGRGLSLRYDGVAALMLLMVSFVGFVVCKYSIRYLDGEATQGRYFRWIALTIGAVSLMVVSGNLLLFFLAWMITSFGLHRLLLHYPHRRAAQRAAWTKFTISRIGDAFLVGALVLTFNLFGTFELSELFSKLKDLAATSQVTASHAAIGWLLVLGAMTKSAQFPFHTWLPETMETPTPVSALMHAGIVNAGGYLIIRMSPLVALAPAALVTLAVVGAFTACFAGVVMMTQPSVKRALAYSTIAQMGFMMLQCGLGAFSAAMLHILAHSLYKAHAFLSSGSVIAQSMSTAGAKSPKPSPRMNIVFLLGAAAATVLAFFAGSTALGLDASAKPGGVVLASILCLAVTTWGWRLFTLGEMRTMFVGVAGASALCLAYVGSYLAVRHLVGSNVAVPSLSPIAQFVFIGVALSFCVLFALHVCVFRQLSPQWLAPIRVHAANGFYVDAICHRTFSLLAKS